MTKTGARLLVLCAAPLLLAACSSKKDTFKREMSEWIKAHPTGVDYCTTLKVPSEAGEMDFGFGGGSFYQPSPVFDDAAKHPILAIEKANAAPNATLDALVKRGLARKESVKHTKYSENYVNVPGQVAGHQVYKYTTTTRTAYVLTKTAGWQVNTDLMNIAAVPSASDQQPQVKSVNVPAIPAGPNAMSPAWCGGKITVKKITQYTEPASEFGRIISEATATLKISGMPAWMSDPAIKPALSAPPKAEYTAKADFEKTSNGWKLVDGIHTNGLYGTNNGF